MLMFFQQLKNTHMQQHYFYSRLSSKFQQILLINTLLDRAETEQVLFYELVMCKTTNKTDKIIKARWTKRKLGSLYSTPHNHKGDQIASELMSGTHSFLVTYSLNKGKLMTSRMGWVSCMTFCLSDTSTPI